MKYDIFLSHSSVNAKQADRIVAALETKGLVCWVAPRNISSGEQWASAITRGLRDSAVLLLYLTPESNNSRPVENEVERMFNQRKPIIPFFSENLQLSDSLDYFLASSHRFYAIGKEFDEAMDHLFQNILHLLSRMRQDELLDPKPPVVEIANTKKTEQTLALEEYAELFETFYDDGIISDNERRQLNKKKDKYQLSPNDIAEIESRLIEEYNTRPRTSEPDDVANNNETNVLANQMRKEQEENDQKLNELKIQQDKKNEEALKAKEETEKQNKIKAEEALKLKEEADKQAKIKDEEIRKQKEEAEKQRKIKEEEAIKLKEETEKLNKIKAEEEIKRKEEEKQRKILVAEALKQKEDAEKQRKIKEEEEELKILAEAELRLKQMQERTEQENLRQLKLKEENEEKKRLQQIELEKKAKAERLQQQKQKEEKIANLKKQEEQEIIKKAQEETNYWQTIFKENTLVAYRNYLKKYPKGKFADEARKFIEVLKPENDIESNKLMILNKNKIMVAILAVAVVSIFIIYYFISSAKGKEFESLMNKANVIYSSKDESKYKEAILIFEKALKLNYENGIAQAKIDEVNKAMFESAISKGETLFAKGETNYVAALQSFELALKLNVNNQKAQTNIDKVNKEIDKAFNSYILNAETMIKAKEPEMAKINLEKAKILKPNDTKLIELLAKI